jgi:hypothetical protein
MKRKDVLRMIRDEQRTITVLGRFNECSIESYAYYSRAMST